MIDYIRLVHKAYHLGLLGDIQIPEDVLPSEEFGSLEAKLRYLTFPMALNYRRQSAQLWTAAAQTWDDPTTRFVFDVDRAVQDRVEAVAHALARYGLARQPRVHPSTWTTIASTVSAEWGSLSQLLKECEFDFLRLRETVQQTHRKGFPYLAGPKLFNYWAFILRRKCDVELEHSDAIDIAVDSHVLRASVALGVVSEDESRSVSSVRVAERWRDLLAGADLEPTDLNVPLWAWSRAGLPDVRSLLLSA